MNDYTDAELIQIVRSYENKKKGEKARYDRIKDTDEFKQKNRAKAIKHYHSNKEKHKEKYLKDKVFISNRSSYTYYKRLGREKEFRNLFPEKVELLTKRGYLSEQKPLESTATVNSSSSPDEQSTSQSAQSGM
tara:strand:+ start:2996 stop:3394 length:399 start_codon:yes stop_codon:yes gene_type:complete